MPLTPARQSGSRTIAATLVAVAALVAGCGGDEGPHLTPAEYAAAADEACAKAREDVAGLEEPATPAAALAYRRATLGIGRDQLVTLRELDVPPALRERHDRALEALAEQHRLLDEALARIDAGEEVDVVVVDISPRVDELELETQAIAHALGLRICGGQGPDTALAGGPEHRAWREDYLTVVDGGLFFAEALWPSPELDELAARDLDLASEAKTLVAAYDRLTARRPPAEASAGHAFIVRELRPVIPLWRELARAVEARDEEAYAAALAGVEAQRRRVVRLERELAP